MLVTTNSKIASTLILWHFKKPNSINFMVSKTAPAVNNLKDDYKPVFTILL